MIGEQLIMLFSNLSLFIPFLISLRTKYLTFIFLTFGVAFASNLYHISNNSDMLEKIFSLTNYEISDIFDFELGLELKLFFLFLDYFFSNVLSAIFIITLAPKNGYILSTPLNLLTALFWIIALFIGPDTKSTSPDASMLVPLITVQIWALLCYIFLIIYYFKTQPKIENDKEDGRVEEALKSVSNKKNNSIKNKKPLSKLEYFKEYYRKHFNVLLLCIGISILLIGLLVWLVVQPLVEDLYFFVHSAWHICITIGSSLILYSIKREKF